jgi:hypothetical protein
MNLSIHRLFEKQPFGPEDIGDLTVAYDRLREALPPDAADELIAKKVIETAQGGIRDTEKIAQHILAQIG